MSTAVKAILVYYVAAAIVSVIMTYCDKRAAKGGRRRVPEKTLFLTAIFGSAAAMYITMRKIRHKTLHKRFMIGLPVITAAKLSAVCGILYLMYGV